MIDGGKERRGGMKGKEGFMFVGILDDDHVVTGASNEGSQSHSESLEKFLDHTPAVAIYHNDEELFRLIDLLSSLVPMKPSRRKGAVK